MPDNLYTKGLVLGKFMPFHLGHQALIQFALSHCESLIVLLCVHEGEEIPASVRMNWLSDLYAGNSRIQLVVFEYDPTELTNRSESSEEDSAKWAKSLEAHFPQVDAFITSEHYGNVVTKYWKVTHLPFDFQRHQVRISATEIRNNPITNWHFLPSQVQPYFVKKIILSGTESTGKSILAERLADYFSTVYVPEAAREIVSVTAQCEEIHLEQIAIAHAQAILRKVNGANKVLFIDTDINITRSYSRFLFNKELQVYDWIESANKGDLYLFLENDAPYVQDGTRLDETDRDILHGFHKRELDERGIPYVSILGSNWEERFLLACQVVEKFIAKN
jgi:HTH-type transcriptional repressor of NAD biosynthesis genes